MRVVAENIKDKFFQIPDVKKVELVGVQPEKIYIQMSNAKLAQLGIPIDTLASTIQAEQLSLRPAWLKVTALIPICV